MTDPRLRALEREYLTTRDPGVGAQLLVGRWRAGFVRAPAIRWAAAFGSESARLAAKHMRLKSVSTATRVVERIVGALSDAEGWALFDDTETGTEVQVIDDPGAWFVPTDPRSDEEIQALIANWIQGTDHEAILHVVRRALAGSSDHRLALLAVRRANQLEYGDMAHAYYTDTYLGASGRAGELHWEPVGPHESRGWRDPVPPEILERVAETGRRLDAEIVAGLIGPEFAMPVGRNSDKELRRLRREVESKPWWRVSQSERETLRRARIRSGDLVCIVCGRQLGRPQDEQDRREDARGLVCWRCFHGMAPNPDERMRERPEVCPQCGGQPMLLGELGGAQCFRCRQCGWHWQMRHGLPAPRAVLPADVCGWCAPGPCQCPKPKKKKKRGKNPGRGDESIRRAQRGEGGDPKLEAWRRGLPVPPDRVEPLTPGSTFTMVGVWEHPDSSVGATLWTWPEMWQRRIYSVSEEFVATGSYPSRVARPLEAAIDWLDPDVQLLASEAYMGRRMWHPHQYRTPTSGWPRTNPPRGDESIRRAQRGEGGDPKLEAWRRGIAVPPNCVWSGGNEWRAYWKLPGGGDVEVMLADIGLHSVRDLPVGTVIHPTPKEIAGRAHQLYGWVRDPNGSFFTTPGTFVVWQEDPGSKGPNWLDPVIQSAVHAAYASPPRTNPPRGDEALRRSQRGEGGDPKLEAWRRGIAVPPDVVRPLRQDWPATTVAYWLTPGAAPIPEHLTPAAPAVWPQAVHAMTWLYSVSGGVKRAYRVYMGEHRRERPLASGDVNTFDYGNPRWDDPQVQQFVRDAYLRALEEQHD